jgi:hypothetical protein
MDPEHLNWSIPPEELICLAEGQCRCGRPFASVRFDYLTVIACSSILTGENEAEADQHFRVA